MSVLVTDIKVGERIREDRGDLTQLAASIEARGLLQAIILAPDRTLVAGERRLEAFKLLHRTHIPAIVVASLADAQAAFLAQRDENVCRKAFNGLEAVRYGRLLERFETPAAAKRKKAGIPQPAGNLPEGQGGRVRDIVGAMVGVSGRTYANACAVVTAAETNPNRYGHLRDWLRGNRSVETACRELRRLQSQVRPRVSRGRRRPEPLRVLDQAIAEAAKPVSRVLLPELRILLRQARDGFVSMCTGCSRRSGRTGHKRGKRCSR